MLYKNINKMNFAKNYHPNKLIDHSLYILSLLSEFFQIRLGSC